MRTFLFPSINIMQLLHSTGIWNGESFCKFYRLLVEFPVSVSLPEYSVAILRDEVDGLHGTLTAGARRDFRSPGE